MKSVIACARTPARGRGAVSIAAAIAAAIVSAGACPAARGQADTAREIVLWPEGVPEPRVPAEPAESVQKGKDGISRRANVSQPRLVAFAPAAAAAAPGAARGAVIVVPGGGFSILADEHEGSDVCRRLAAEGIAAFLLLHRAPTGTMPVPNAGPVADVQKSVYEVRRRARELGVDSGRIAVLGFSAGGQATLVAAAGPPRFTPADAAVSSRPDAALVIYPWRILADDGKSLRPEVTIDATTPPFFIAQCGDDTASLPAGAATLYLRLVEAKVPAEIHVYERGGHGFGMRPRDDAPGTADWLVRALDWLRGRGIIAAAPATVSPPAAAPAP
jgi:acetyl esterase/lipase